MTFDFHNPVDALFALIGVSFALAICAAGITAGVIITCRLLNWAPVIVVSNTDVNTSGDVTVVRSHD